LRFSRVGDKHLNHNLALGRSPTLALRINFGIPLSQRRLFDI
jgi:hypothetical protein